jgi:hypothetical protein
MRIVRMRVSPDRRTLDVKFAVDAERAADALALRGYNPSPFEMGWRFGGELARKMGLDPNRVGKITMTIDPSKAVTIEVQVFAADLLHSHLEHYRLVRREPTDDVP